MEYIVEMLNISKAFGGVKALRSVDFRIKKGEIHALVGENGAGKSTLMKVLSGAIMKDEGTIRINGEEADIRSTTDAIRHNVAVIYQELNLVPDLTVAENLYLGEDISGKNTVVRWKDLYEKTGKMLTENGFDIDPKEKVGNLTVAYQQMVEIAKSVTRNADVIVLDEPTAVLTASEAENLFEIILRLKNEGKSIIYISHRMEEIFRLSDRVTVMKDGAVTGTVESGAVTNDDIINLMIGRTLGDMFPEKSRKPGKIVLEAKDLRRGNKVKGVSFNVKSGEVLGIFGLVGAGKTETARLLFGADKMDGGAILIDGKEMRITTPKTAMKAGISYVSEDRKGQGVILDMSVRENITMPMLENYTFGPGIVKAAKEKADVLQSIEKLNVKTESTETKVQNLSGGNQQKVSIAKWIDMDSKVIILDEPTRGVDVGAKVEIYKLIHSLARGGLAVILISSEMIEVIGMSDRVLVLHEGRIRGELSGNEISESNIISCAIGR